MKYQQVKTKLPVVVIKGITKILFIAKHYLATVLLAVAFFVHFFMPHPEPEVFRAKKIKIESENVVGKYKDEIVKLAGTGSDKIVDLKEALRLAEIELAKSNDLFRTMDAQHRIFGYPSRHKFLWSFGLGLMFTILSIKIYFDSHQKSNRHERISDIILAFMTGVVGGYFFAWIFYPSNDLPYSVYMTVLVSLGVLGSVLGYFLSKAMQFRRNKLLEYKAKIYKALDFFVETRNVHMKNVVKPVIEKDLYDEAFQEAISQETKEFEKRMHETADEILD